MTISKLLTATVLGGAITAGAAFAAGPAENAIKARKAAMQLYAFNLGQLGAMAKAEAAYDAAAASAAASNLVALASLDQSALWPEGSDSLSAENTRALPDLWENLPDVMQKSQEMISAAEAMETAAGTDLAALQEAMKALGGACGACHKPYRAPD